MSKRCSINFNVLLLVYLLMKTKYSLCRASLLMTVMETLRGFVDIYGGLNSFPEIFLPLARLLLDLAQQENMPAGLQEKFKDAAEVIKKKVDEHHMVRQPLQMCKKKPVPIKLLNPKFEEK